MKSNKQFDAIVIGSGLGGLTAGARLAKEGRKVLVLEQHYIPGGCATTFKRKDFLMEVGLHEMDGLDAKDPKTALFKALGIFDNLELIRVPEFYRVLCENPGGMDFTLPDHIKKAKEKLIQKFPEEKSGIKKFFWLITGMRNNVLKFGKLKKWQRKVLFPLFPVIFPFLALASGPASHTLSLTNPLFWIFRGWKFAFFRYFTIGDYLDSILKDEHLKMILIANLGYYHDDPYSLNLSYFCAAQSSYMEGGGWYIKGGSQKLSDYLAAYIEERSGSVQMGKRVTEIITENGTATGIKYQNTFDATAPVYTSHAEVIIGNAPIPNIANMLTGADQKILKSKIKKLKPSVSLLTVYIGFNANIAKKYGNKAYSTFLMGSVSKLKDFKSRYHLDFDQRGFVFVDYSKIDSGLTSPDKTVGALCTVSHLQEWEKLDEETYKKKKERVAQSFIKRLNKLLPGISRDIAHYEVATPRTIQSYTLSPAGTAYGYAQTPEQSPEKRPQFEAPIKNLYFSSAWTFPGGGFTGAIIAGIGASDQILSKHKKNPDLSPIKPKDTQTARLIERRKIAKNTLELVFEKPSDFDHFSSGQYAVVRLENPKYRDLDMPLRSLSIASHPGEKVLRFAMRDSKSAFKRSCAALEPGATAKIYGPVGNFTLKNNERDLLFLISGIGITPVISMLKELEMQQREKKILLLYSNPYQENTAYDAELKKISLKNFHYINRCSRVDGRIDPPFLEKYVGDFKAFDYYLVGTSPFIRSMKKILKSKGVSTERLYIDDFG